MRVLDRETNADERRQEKESVEVRNGKVESGEIRDEKGDSGWESNIGTNGNMS